MACATSSSGNSPAISQRSLPRPRLHSSSGSAGSLGRSITARRSRRPTRLSSGVQSVGPCIRQRARVMPAVRQQPVMAAAPQVRNAVENGVESSWPLLHGLRPVVDERVGAERSHEMTPPGTRHRRDVRAPGFRHLHRHVTHAAGGPVDQHPGAAARLPQVAQRDCGDADAGEGGAKALCRAARVDGTRIRPARARTRRTFPVRGRMDR